MAGQQKDDQRKASANSGLRCPTCGAPAAAPAAPGERSPRPFCSSRCSDVDLGRWFQGQYAVPAVDAADDTIIESIMAEARADGRLGDD